MPKQPSKPVIELHVLSHGAGVQSTTLHLLAEEGKIHFDVAIFSDPGEEDQRTYDHVVWLQNHCRKVPLWVRSLDGRLGDHLMLGRNSTGQRFASIPAFTAESHLTRPAGKFQEGRVRRQCTVEYKVEVVEKAIRRELVGLQYRQRMPKSIHIHQYLGISLEEVGRAKRAAKRFDGVKWCTPHWPLIEMGWTRADCIRYLDGKVPHVVPKSSCVFCPYKSRSAWIRMKETRPAEWARSVEIDEALRRPGVVVNRGLDQSLYLIRTCVPLATANLMDLPDDKLDPMVEECTGMCGL
jgi:hypothetical protein